MLVISNADPKRTYRTLFEPADLPGDLANKIEDLKTSGYFKFHCVMDKAPDVSAYLTESDIDAADVSYMLKRRASITMPGRAPRCALANLFGADLSPSDSDHL